MDRIWIDYWLERHPPTERRHLRTLLRAPADRTAALEAYAAYLERDENDENDPDGAKREALRAILAISGASAAHETELRGRLRRALTDLPPEWLAVVLPTSVRNCGVPGPKAPPAVRFDYACPRRWETLQPTDDPTIRRCDACARPVFRCDDLDTAEARARNGDCIAVDSTLALQGRDRGIDLWPAETLSVERGLMIEAERVAPPTWTWGARLFGKRSSKGK